MPFTPAEIAQAGKAALDFFLKNKPIDQITEDRPLLKALQAKKRTFPGAKQFVVEQLRKSYDSNFQWFNGDQTVTYNRRDTLEQTNYPWRSAHDGLSLTEDQLAQNGVTLLDDGKGRNATGAERMQLTNLLDENLEVLRLGMEERFSAAVHANGTSSSDSIAGLDALISTTPTVGVVGGIDRATNPWWRNHVSLNIASANLLIQMENNWRACIRSGGRPDVIIAGSDFINAYIQALKDAGQQINSAGGKPRDLDGGVGSIFFKNVEIQWSPEFDNNFGEVTVPAIPWSKRCYFINSRHLRLRPMEGQDFISRNVPRVYDKYVYYWAITWRGAMTMNRSSAHAVLSVS